MQDMNKTELEVLKFWGENKIYEKVKKKNAKGKKFYFLQGPPYTSGKLHIGHAWNNSLKDIILRYKRMQGLNVWDRGGYDMHGLPTENAVQRKLGYKNKEEIVSKGIDKFIKACMDFSIEHAGYMNKDFLRLGIWMDHENAYKPVEKSFISGEWSFFKKAWEQKRLYKGKKVLHWDAEAETSLAKHELEYETIKDESVFLKFKKKGTKKEYFVIWTTTPWTIGFNLAIMANPELEYVKVEVDEEYWILAKALASVFITGLLGKKFKIIEEFLGEGLEGQEYEHFFDKDMNYIYKDLKKEWRNLHTIILSKEYVDTSSGTGLVHCAPGCGPEDFEVGKKYGLGPFNTLNERGEYESPGKFKGWVARVDDHKFIKEFKNSGVLITTTEVEHEYPFSARTHKPVVFRTTEQWFLKTEDLIPDLLKLNNEVNWVPKRAGDSYRNWTENLKDNGVTRQRFWGCPVPIWINVKDSEDVLVTGSVEELERLSGKNFNDLTIHRPWIDEVTITKGKKVYKRIPDVVDVWIDSGTVSWNCLYNDRKLIEKYFPADLVLEATEQTRLWFSMLQICSAVMFGETSYKNVFVHGMILDYQGTKMSKSLGNIISPYEVVEKYCADLLRYYMCEIRAGENINFNWEDIKVKQRNLMMFSNIANYILDLEKQKIQRGVIGLEEKWILSRYYSTLSKVTDLFESYKIDETITAIEELSILLSRDYIKLVRDKASENLAVKETVKEIYFGLLKMFSTIVPFTTEHIWQNFRKNKLVKEESVHLCDWPKADKKRINEKLENEFSDAFRIIEKGLAERDKAKIGLRWPLAKAIIHSKNVFSKELAEVITRQLNVKEIVLIKTEQPEEVVELDLAVTSELEAEGFARELARKIQAERKNAGLQKPDVIELTIFSNKEGQKILQSQISFLKDRTNAEKLEFVSLEKADKSKEFKIKEKVFAIGFKKV